MTNFEWIKSLDLNGLAKLLCSHLDCGSCPVWEYCSEGKNGMVAWMKEDYGIETKSCENCRYHDDFTWVCFNGESENRADITDTDDCCKFWEAKDDGEK